MVQPPTSTLVPLDMSRPWHSVRTLALLGFHQSWKECDGHRRHQKKCCLGNPRPLSVGPTPSLFGVYSVLAGFCSASGQLVCPLTGILALILLAKQTPIEEAKLIERFGDEYRDYMKCTGRFVPRLLRSQ